MPILNWLFCYLLLHTPIQNQWADLGRLPKPPKTMHDRINQGYSLYPCNLLFVHRDAEGDTYESRESEIENALCQSILPESISTICVIPKRMTEAWLLIDEKALRQAVGNPNGRQELEMPDIKKLEELREPMEKLCELFRHASGLTGRRLKSFQDSDHKYRLAELIQDFSSLKQLSAFQKLEINLRNSLQRLRELGHLGSEPCPRKRK